MFDMVYAHVLEATKCSPDKHVHAVAQWDTDKKVFRWQTATMKDNGHVIIGWMKKYIVMQLWKYVALSLSWALHWITNNSDRVDVMFLLTVLNLASKFLNFIVLWISSGCRMKLPTGTLKLVSGILSTYFMRVPNL